MVWSETNCKSFEVDLFTFCSCYVTRSIILKIYLNRSVDHAFLKVWCDVLYLSNSMFNRNITDFFYQGTNFYETDKSMHCKIKSDLQSTYFLRSPYTYRHIYSANNRSEIRYTCNYWQTKYCVYACPVYVNTHKVLVYHGQIIRLCHSSIHKNFMMQRCLIVVIFEQVCRMRKEQMPNRIHAVIKKE